MHKTLPLKAGQRLDVEHQNGDVRLRGVPGGELKVDAKIRVSSSDMEEAKKFSDAISDRDRLDGHGSDRPDALSGRKVVLRLAAGVLRGGLRHQRARGGRRLGSQPLRRRDAPRISRAARRSTTPTGRLTFRGGKGVARLENSFGPLELSGNVGRRRDFQRERDDDDRRRGRAAPGPEPVRARHDRPREEARRSPAATRTSRSPFPGPSSVTTSFGAVTVMTVNRAT